MGFVDSLPQGKTRDELAARDAAIVAAVAKGHAELQWVTLAVGGLRVQVMADALKLDGVRVCVSATAEQQIADLLGAVMLTPLLCDRIYRAAPVKLPPKPLTQTPADLAVMAHTATMVKHSALIDAALGGRTGLVADVGKDWVLTNKLAQGVKSIPAGMLAANYGWHIKTGGEASVDGQGRVIQGVGYRHDRSHVDYSQVCRLARVGAELDGRAIDLRAVYTDPQLAPLVSHEGALKLTRQPGVSSTPELGGPPRGSGDGGLAALALGMLVGFA